ncbi:hypothetical protein [Niveibacterium terrae]
MNQTRLVRSSGYPALDQAAQQAAQARAVSALQNFDFEWAD